MGDLVEIRREVEIRDGTRVEVGKRAWFWCPGCEGHHAYRVEGNEPVWKWNGSKTSPTFTPSLLVQGSIRCHLYVTDGMIRFLSDCQHKLAGQTVPVEPPV